jgi:hypothetical protein
MHSLFAQGMLALDMTGTLRNVGLIGGIILLVIWLMNIKNTTALFHDKKKIRATIMFGAPGLILLIIGIVLFATGKPMSSYIYVANYSAKEGKVEVDGQEFKVAAGTWEKLEVRSKEESYSIKAFLGDSAVFDTTMGDGSYIASLSDDKIVVAEEVEYSTYSFSSGSDDLSYEILMSPGIAKFSDNTISDLYDFDESAPETMSVSKGSSSVRKFDLQLMSQAEMFKMMMDALGDDKGGLMDSLGGDEEYDEEVMDEEVDSLGDE